MTFKLDLTERDSGVVVVAEDVDVVVLLFRPRGAREFSLVGRGTVAELGKAVAELVNPELLGGLLKRWRGR